jgi:hypothetical protein
MRHGRGVGLFGNFWPNSTTSGGFQPPRMVVSAASAERRRENNVSILTLRFCPLVGRRLISRIRRNRQSPGPAHGCAIEFIGDSTNQAYLVVLAIDAGVRPGKTV